MERRPAIVAYDVSCNRRRRRVNRVLAEWRLDGQRTVHECLLSTAEAEDLFTDLVAELDPCTDRALLAWVVPGRRVLARGLGRADTFARKLARAE